MKWKNPDELRELGFWLKGHPTEEDATLEYELCLADDESAVCYDISITFNKEPRPPRPGADALAYSYVFAGAELFIHKLERERLGGPFARGAFVASRPLFFSSFRDVETFVSALTGTTPLFPEEREPSRKELAPGMEELFRCALTVLHTGAG
jgi:hypothetical protein